MNIIPFEKAMATCYYTEFIYKYNIIFQQLYYHPSNLRMFVFNVILLFFMQGISMEKKSYHQLKSDFQDDTFNKFEPHEACWDLFKRGGVGETPFQLCYLMDTPVHLEVGKTLLEVFPKLALDMYEGEEYFGKLDVYEGDEYFGKLDMYEREEYFDKISIKI